MVMLGIFMSKGEMPRGERPAILFSASPIGPQQVSFRVPLSAR